MTQKEINETEVKMNGMQKWLANREKTLGDGPPELQTVMSYIEESIKSGSGERANYHEWQGVILEPPDEVLRALYLAEKRISQDGIEAILTQKFPDWVEITYYTILNWESTGFFGFHKKKVWSGCIRLVSKITPVVPRSPVIQVECHKPYVYDGWF